MSRQRTPTIDDVIKLAEAVGRSPTCPHRTSACTASTSRMQTRNAVLPDRNELALCAECFDYTLMSYANTIEGTWIDGRLIPT